LSTNKTRDHGGGLDAAVTRFGGSKSDWIDLSTGINPTPYPLPEFAASSWHTLPDKDVTSGLESAARKFWHIPDTAAVLAAPGASSLIARMPTLIEAGAVAIQGPTYNEHEAAFRAEKWVINGNDPKAKVLVHPNNPDGKIHPGFRPDSRLTIIDESFGDVASSGSLMHLSTQSGVIILKSFGKFWGLAGVRLGFAIGDPKLIAKLGEMLGPWPVSGPAISIGTTALGDMAWAEATRHRLTKDAAKLDRLMTERGAKILGGTTLFRLYHVDDAIAWQTRLAKSLVWSRVFPYSKNWLRLGLPDARNWDQLSAAI